MGRARLLRLRPFLLGGDGGAVDFEGDAGDAVAGDVGEEADGARGVFEGEAGLSGGAAEGAPGFGDAGDAAGSPDLWLGWLCRFRRGGVDFKR